MSRRIDREVGPARPMISAEQFEALRRASSDPDLDSGDFDEEQDRRVYQPLVRAGLLTCEVRPHPDPDVEIVFYQTTERGRMELAHWDLQRERGARRAAGGAS